MANGGAGTENGAGGGGRLPPLLRPPSAWADRRFGGRTRFPAFPPRGNVSSMRSVIFPIVLGGVLLAVGGCAGLTPQQQAWLASGEQAYQQRHFDRAITTLSQFIASAAGRPEVARALYVRALARARTGQRVEARQDLLRCVQTATDPDLRWRAYSVLGTLDYEDGRWDSAARAYAGAAETAPPRPPTDLILFRFGVCLERSGRWAAAREPFRRIVTEFPRSSAARDAQRRLQINADHFAVQCGVFGELRNAQSRAIELERQGISAYVRREPRNGVFKHVVLVGHFSTYEQAKHELARVKAYVPDAVLWP